MNIEDSPPAKLTSEFLLRLDVKFSITNTVHPRELWLVMPGWMALYIWNHTIPDNEVYLNKWQLYRCEKA